MQSNTSHRAGEKRSKYIPTRLSAPFKAAGALAMSATMMLSTPAFANDSASKQVASPTPVAMNTTTTPAPATPASIQNPYVSACDNDDINTAEFKKACIDAANGTVVILRNPDEVSDIARDIFSKAVHDEYNGQIPLEFRDTTGPTTVFLFDKNMPIDRDMLVNGSLLYVLGVRYPEKVTALNNVASVTFN